MEFSWLLDVNLKNFEKYGKFFNPNTALNLLFSLVPDLNKNYLEKPYDEESEASIHILNPNQVLEGCKNTEDELGCLRNSDKKITSKPKCNKRQVCKSFLELKITHLNRVAEAQTIAISPFD